MVAVIKKSYQITRFSLISIHQTEKVTGAVSKDLPEAIFTRSLNRKGNTSDQQLTTVIRYIHQSGQPRFYQTPGVNGPGVPILRCYRIICPIGWPAIG
jgi:hypothetical protein